MASNKMAAANKEKVSFINACKAVSPPDGIVKYEQIYIKKSKHGYYATVRWTQDFERWTKDVLAALPDSIKNKYDMSEFDVLNKKGFLRIRLPYDDDMTSSFISSSYGRRIRKNPFLLRTSNSLISYLLLIEYSIA